MRISCCFYGYACMMLVYCSKLLPSISILSPRQLHKVARGLCTLLSSWSERWTLSKDWRYSRRNNSFSMNTMNKCSSRCWKGKYYISGKVYDIRFISRTNRKLGPGVVVHTFPSVFGRQGSDGLRPVWPMYLFPGHPEIHDRDPVYKQARKHKYTHIHTRKQKQET